MYLFEEVSYLNEWLAFTLLVLFVAAYLVPIVNTEEYPYWKQYLISLGCVFFGIGFLLLLLTIACLFAYVILGRN